MRRCFLNQQTWATWVFLIAAMSCSHMPALYVMELFYLMSRFPFKRRSAYLQCWCSWSYLSVYCCAVLCGFSKSANRPCLLLSSLKASIFVPSFLLFLNWLQWVSQHSQCRYIMDKSVLLGCLNYTLTFRFGTDAIDPATVNTQVDRRSLWNVFHCKVQYVPVNPVCWGDKRL